MAVPGGPLAQENEGSRLPSIILKVFAIGGVLLVAVVGVLGYIGWQDLQRKARGALEGNPVIEEHIGEVTELRLVFKESIEMAGEDDFFIRIRGDRGSGEVTATLVTTESDTEELVAGELRLADGRVLSLFPEDEAPAGTDER